MNYLILVAGILVALATIGHFTIGQKLYMKPVLNSDLDELPKRIMHALFHYASVVLIVSALVLIAAGIGAENCPIYSLTAVRIIAIIFLGFAVVQVLVGARSKEFKKMFQWIFWLLIAVLAGLGSCPFC